MRSLDTATLVLWSLATLGLAFAIVQRAVRVRTPRAGRACAWAALLGAVASLALVARAMERGLLVEMSVAGPGAPFPWNLLQAALSSLVVGLPVAAALCATWALVRGAHAGAEGAARWRTILEVLALLGPIGAVVVAWIAFGKGLHPTVQYTGPEERWAWSFWVDAWPILMEGLPISAGVVLVIGVVHATVLDRRDAGGVASRYGWCLGVHAFAWYATAVNFPSA